MTKKYGCPRCSGDKFVNYGAIRSRSTNTWKFPCPACHPHFRDPEADYTLDGPEIEVKIDRRVIKTDINGNMIKEYTNMASAAWDNNTSKEMVSNYCNSDRKSSFSRKLGCGFEFKIKRN